MSRCEFERVFGVAQDRNAAQQLAEFGVGEDWTIIMAASRYSILPDSVYDYWREDRANIPDEVEDSMKTLHLPKGYMLVGMAPYIKEAEVYGVIKWLSEEL